MTDGTITRATYRKVMARVVWPLALLIVLSSIDRVNLSFAALEMNADLGINPEAYGLAVGLFFAGYLLFQLPSSTVLQRIGPRRWIGGSVIGWGTVSTCMALIEAPWQLYVLRFLLGVFESGFAPGVVWFVGRWLPAAYRARAIAGTLLAIPTSVILGGPFSGLLLSIDVAGVDSWRLMFAVQGLLTVLAGVIAIFWFADRPAQARWLAAEEARRLESTIEAEVIASGQARVQPLRQIVRDPLLWMSAAIWLVLISGSNAIIFWLPLAIKMFGLHDPLEIGILSALPWVAIATGMALNSRHSDLTGERYLHLALPMLLGAAGLGLSAALSGHGALALGALIVGSLGIGAAQSVFWTVPTRFLGAHNPSAIAMINLCGNTGSLVVPVLIGWSVSLSASVAIPAYAIALFLLVGSLFVLPLKRLGTARIAAAGPQELERQEKI